MMDKGLYIHIPFCEKICSYCDFCKVLYNAKYADLYLDELFKEIDSYSIDDISSIYIGGGTPTSLNIEQLERLLLKVTSLKGKDISLSIEANIENLNEEKIILLKKYNVDRISIGVQSFNEKLLKIMNRKHTFFEVKEKIDLLHKYDINDINIDLIYGFEEENLQILNDDLEKILSLGVTHISLYSLMINDNTLLKIRGKKEISQDLYRNYYDFIYTKLVNNGFYRYEVSNFSKIGYESKHNLLYWRNKEYYGVGLGASGYLNGVRYTNTKSLTKYLQGERIFEKEECSESDKEFYSLMLGLRLEEGINIEEFNSLYDKDLLISYKEKIEKLIRLDLLKIENGRLKITKDNFYIMDYILKELL